MDIIIAILSFLLFINCTLIPKVLKPETKVDVVINKMKQEMLLTIIIISIVIAISLLLVGIVVSF